jgi:THO complex subunit 1
MMAVTSVAELASVASIIAKLQTLLEQAKTIKPTASVEPALPTAELVPAVDSLDADIDEEYASDQAYRFAAVETAAREQFYSILSQTSIQEPEFVAVWNLLDVLLLCGDRGVCTPELVCWLIEELLDSQTTHGCRIVFDYLESRRERLARKDFHKKNLVFLRSCNELLRRLSRAEDAIFCGRVFFFLFQTFPLGDKSSVNLRGEFHVENSTKFDLGEQPSNDGETMDVDQDDTKTEASTPKPATPATEPPPQPTGRAGSRAVPIKAPKKTIEEEVLDNSTLYPIFWRLQQDFSDPTRLFAAGNFQSFKNGLAATLLKFKKTPTVQTRSSESQRGTKRKIAGGDMIPETKDQFADNYNPKYLTSRELFDLELSDLAFQRHILVQALILIHFLLSLTEQSKKKLATPDAVNKSLLYSFTLNEEDTKWALSTRQTIKQSLQSTTDGRFYDRMVETVLARDKNWVRWKVESCPSIVRDAVSTEQELEARRGAKQHTRPRKIPEKPMGAMDWSFLVETNGGGLEALKDPSRFGAPSMDDLLKGIEVDKLDMDFAMSDAETAKFTNMIGNKSWRVVREARVHKLGMLDGFEPNKELKDVFKQSEKHESSEEVAAEGQDSTPKAEEQTEDKVEALAEDKDTIDGPSAKQQGQEQPATMEIGELADQTKSPTAAPEDMPAVAESEKTQTDDSITA